MITPGLDIPSNKAAFSFTLAPLKFFYWLYKVTKDLPGTEINYANEISALRHNYPKPWKYLREPEQAETSNYGGN